MPVQPILQALLLIGWIAAITITTRGYLRSRRRGFMRDSILWFVLWCLVISFVEWPVLFVYQIIYRGFLGIDASL